MDCKGAGIGVSMCGKKGISVCMVHGGLQGVLSCVYFFFLFSTVVVVVLATVVLWTKWWFRYVCIWWAADSPGETQGKSRAEGAEGGPPQERNGRDTKENDGRQQFAEDGSGGYRVSPTPFSIPLRRL